MFSVQEDLRAARDSLVRSSAVTLLRQATLSRGNGSTVDGTQRAALANASEVSDVSGGFLEIYRVFPSGEAGSHGIQARVTAAARL